MLVHHLAKYAAYHCNPRNIATHMVGIPLIVMAVVLLLSRPIIHVGNSQVTPAMIVALPAVAYYVRLDRLLGAMLALLLAVTCWLGLDLAGTSTPTWLGIAVGAFVLGWIIQFAGHAIEGRKPAFFDDMRGLLIGPLFVVAEIVFALGGRAALHRAVQAEQRNY